MSFQRGPFLLMFAVGNQLAALLRVTMAKAPLTPDDFGVTSALRLAGAVRAGELAALLGMRPTTMSNYLRRLSDAGLIERVPDVTDGRASLVVLTADGLRRTEECFPAFSAAVEAFEAALRERGVAEDQLVALLEDVSAAIASASELPYEAPRSGQARG